MKKVMVLATALAVLFSVSGAALGEAPPPVLVGEGLETAMDALEQAQLQTSADLPEQAMLQNEFNNRRIEALENAMDLDEEAIEAILAYLDENEGKLGLIIAELARDRDFPGDDSLLEAVANDIDERGWRLAEILEDEELPAGALAGVAGALANMEEAFAKAEWALNRDQAGPPEWATNRGERETQQPAVETGPPVELPQPPEGDLPDPVPPVEPPVEVSEPPVVDAPPETPAKPGVEPTLPVTPPAGR